MTSADLSLDPVTLEITWERLQAVADEAEVTLVRTCFSPIIREANDYGVMVLDSEGGSVAQSQRSMPSFVGTLPRTVRAASEIIPPDSLRPGDVLGTNDPWLGTGHLPDVTMFRPVFRSGRLIAYIGCIGHWADIGGAIWSADSKELFEEGLRLPLSKFATDGRFNDDLMRVIMANVRLPEQVRGDVYAQLASMDVGARRLNEFLDEMDIDDPAPIFAEIQRRSEEAMRAAITSIPDGTYSHEIEIDGAGDPLTLRVSVTVSGSEMHIDWTGSSPQTDWAINDSFNHAYAMSVYPVKCALCPDVPNNQGSYRPITMTAPEGTIVNCKYPAAVAARQMIGHFLSAVVQGAIAQVVPERVMADSGSPAPRFVFTGLRPDGTKFGAAFLLSGGMGALHNRDGLSAAPWPSNAGTTSVEIVETSTPLLFRRRSLIPDSGGGGRFRGGLGVATEIELGGELPATLSMMTDRVQHPPLGRFGGLPGSPNILTRSGSAEPIGPKSRTAIKPGELVRMQTPGGAGYGPPHERDPELVRRDVEYGYVSSDAAARIYGHPGISEAPTEDIGERVAVGDHR